MIRTSSSDRRPWLIIAILTVVTVIVYGHLFTNDFLNLDDDIYITHNYWVKQGLTADSIRWAFGFADKHGTYWQPLTWLSLMLDYELFQLNPAAYHLENLFLHIACAGILFQLLRKMTGALWRPALVAALFALHPLNVENVAWAVERKSILSALFFLLALLAYGCYVRRPSLPAYLAVFLAMAVGLTAKSMIVTLPCVLLLLDFWPLGRLRLTGKGEWAGIGRLTLEKTPLFALALVSVAVSVYSLKADPLNVAKGYLPPLTLRISEALVSYVRYLGKLVWPTKLAVYYPPQAGYPGWQVVSAALLLAALTLLALRLARKQPWLCVGWLWFLGMMLPVSGLMRAGLWPAMADRFAYLPFIGLFIAIAWSLPLDGAMTPGRMRLIVAVACVALLGLGLRTWQQTGLWKTSRTLFSHALKVAPDNFMVRNNYGHSLLMQGRAQEAVEQFEMTLKFRPDYAKAYFNLGTAFDVLEEPEAAETAYRETLRLDPYFTDAHVNLGGNLGARGKFLEAQEHFELALKKRPHDPIILHDIGVNSMNIGQPDKAEEYLREAVRRQPSHLAARLHLGQLLEARGKKKEALSEYREVLKLSPGNEEAARKLAAISK